MPQLLSFPKSFKKKTPTSNFMFAEHNRRPSRERGRERGTQIEREFRKRL
jgi:hypothetical protein